LTGAVPETHSAAASAFVAPAVAIVYMEFAVNGFGHGLMQEFLRASLRLNLPESPDWAAVDDALAAIIPRSRPDTAAPATSAVDRIIYWTAELQRAGNQPVFTRGKHIGPGEAAGTILVALPTLSFAATEKALKVIVHLMSGLLSGDAAPDALIDDVRAACAAYVTAFSSKGVGGSNTTRFLQAAQENRMPWFRLSASVFQIGHGAKARLLDSSFTDATSVIGSNLARNKIAAADVLRQSGLPVPEHALVDTPEKALEIAATLGYPVVVKPLDKDGGMGVAAGLKDEAGVVQAFENARKFSKSIMVEKHVEGRDYRLVVLHGQLIWALERVPGSVTGDGVSSVRQLIEQRNLEPARLKRFGAPLSAIEINEEARSLLAERGMDFDSVPEAGDWIRLRRASNIATGGTPEGVFEKVHPDNRLLAERAAKALRLDLAGVDLLIPDIERSWMESGGAICEVNSQPTIGNTTSAHLYGQILKSLVQADGRIPIALIVGAAETSTVPDLVAHMLAATGLRTGLATSRRLVLQGRPLTNTPRNPYHAARALLIDGATDAAVVAVSDMTVAKTYLPFDRCAVVTLAGSHFTGATDSRLALKSLARQLLPMSWGSIAVNAADPDCVALVPAIKGGRVALASAGAGMTAVADHMKAGGPAVYVEGDADNPRLVVGKDVLFLREVVGEHMVFTCPLEDIVLAVSTVWTMGGTMDDIRRGLSGVRWSVPA
jgi:cyanophycin synthetase